MAMQNMGVVQDMHKDSDEMFNKSDIGGHGETGIRYQL